MATVWEMEELGGARARFATVVAKWRLDANATAALVGLDGDWTGALLMEIVGAVNASGEACMRLACEVDALLYKLVPAAEVAGWLRTPAVGYEDDLVTPLKALSTGPGELRALRRYLERLPSPPSVPHLEAANEN
jgi:hypothetical protein